MKAEYEKQVFHYLEYGILLKSLGVNRIYGFALDDIDKANKEECYQCIFDMVNRGILKYEDNHFSIVPVYKELFQAIGGAEMSLILYPRDDEWTKRFCYIGKKIIVTETSHVKEKRIMVFEVPKEEFLAFCFSEYQISFGQQESDEDSEFIQDEKKDMDRYRLLDYNEVIKEKGIQYAIDLVNTRDGELKHRCIIKKTNDKYNIFTLNQETENKYPLMKKVFCQEVERMIGGSL